MPDLINFNGDKERGHSIPMDPELIERVKDDDGNIYTVVSKPGSESSSPEKRPNIQRREPNKDLPSGSQKYSHLVHDPNPRRSFIPTEEPVATKKKPPIKPKRPPPSSSAMYSQLNKKLDRKPYDDVEEKHLILTPVNRRESEQDNEMWMAVKWQTLPPERTESLSSSQRSSSQTALDEMGVMEIYSNVSDLATGNAFIPQQRRHSFTEGDSSIIITSPNQMETFADDGDDPVYSNYNEELYTIPPDADGRDGDYSEVNDDDYVNTGAESLEPPSYENRDEVRQKLMQLSSAKPAKVIKKELPPSSVKDMILESLRFKKPETVTVIQSSSLSHSEKKQTLGMFSFADPKSRRLQVGRGDYEQFKLDSWNETSPSSSSSNRPGKRPSPPSRPPNRFPNRPKLSPSPITTNNNPAPIKVVQPTDLPPSHPPVPAKSLGDNPPPGVNVKPFKSVPSLIDKRTPTLENEKSKAFIRPHLPLSQVKSQPHLEPPTAANKVQPPPITKQQLPPTPTTPTG